MTRHELDTHIDTFGGDVKRRKRLTTTVAIFAVVVALFTAYMLIMPGVTMEQKEAVCGKVEHTHDATCYTQTLTCELPEAQVHVHTPSCYNAAGNLTCAITPAVHMHLDQCYAVGGELICTDVTPGHVHTAACYAKPGDLICVQEEFAHIHRASCYDANGVLTCKVTLPHVHGDTCYNEDNVLVCTLPSAGHVHCDACWQHAGDLICTITETAATPAAATPTVVATAATEAGAGDAAAGEPGAVEVTTTEVIPATPGHVHGPECYASADTLICGQTEQVVITHKHDDSCYERVYTCGLEEHAHDEVCFDAETYQMIQATEENKAKLEAEDEAAAEAAAEAATTLGVVATFENDLVKVEFEVPTAMKGELQLDVQETPIDQEMLEAVTEANTLDIEPVLDVESVDVEEDEDGDLDVDVEEETVEEATLATQSAEEPDWVTNLTVKATLDGKPVDNVADLGIQMKVTVKDQAVSPLLNSVDLNAVAEEAREDVAVAVTVAQVPTELPDLSLAEQPDFQSDTMEITQPGVESTYLMTLAAEDVVLYANAPSNPHFTVEYKADISVPRLLYKTADGKKYGYKDENGTFKEVSVDTTNLLEIIDTTGAKLPVNGTTPALSYLQLNTNGSVVMKTEETEVYSKKECTYYEAPSLPYFDKVYKNENYDGIKLIRITRSDGSKKEYTENLDDIHFTNREETAKKNENYILITEGTVITLVYSTDGENKPFPTSFYDYDITYQMISTSSNPTKDNGQATSDQSLSKYAGTTWYTRTSNGTENGTNYGINSNDNYSNSGTRLAFGNANTGTGLGNLTWNGNRLNRYNGTAAGNGYKGCTFGLVNSLEEGAIQYSSGVSAPNLFNDGTAIGKTEIDGNNQLVFIRNGDTYTLTSAVINDQTLGGLQNFSNPGVYDGVQNSNKIWTNNFWPMDYSYTWGSVNHDLKFGNSASSVINKRKFVGTAQAGYGSTANFPPSDDGKDHNSYFGMNYSVDFTLDSEYVGPLEYLFFGDDDLWIFLDGTLVLDIGGVHSSVGEHVNLWDWINKLPEEDRFRTHTLSIYYTERGASGSTCYMNFTLPSVSTSTPINDTGKLKVAKNVAAAAGSAAFDDEFEFGITLTDKDGNKLRDDYSYTRFKNDGTTESNLIIWDGGTFSLKSGEYIIIEYLPIGAKYSIWEMNAISENGEQKDIANDTEYLPGYEFIPVKGDPQSGKSTLDEKTGEKHLVGSDVDIDGDGVKEFLVGYFKGEITDKGSFGTLTYTNVLPYELPATGGIGTVWFFVGGALLISIGVVMFIRKPRKVSQD